MAKSHVFKAQISLVLEEEAVRLELLHALLRRLETFLEPIKMAFESWEFSSHISPHSLSLSLRAISLQCSHSQHSLQTITRALFEISKKLDQGMILANYFCEQLKVL